MFKLFKLNAVFYVGFKIYLISFFQILIEVDNLQDAPSRYLQIKGVNKEAVAAAGSMLKLDGSYTTKVLPLLLKYSIMVTSLHTHQPAIYTNHHQNPLDRLCWLN